MIYVEFLGSLSTVSIAEVTASPCPTADSVWTPLLLAALHRSLMQASASCSLQVRYFYFRLLCGLLQFQLLLPFTPLSRLAK